MSEASFPDRWVRVMCDYTAAAVWNGRGESCDPEDLPITPDLVARLRAWQKIYDAQLDHDDEHESFDVKAFSALGLVLAREVKRQLPDWTVVYFDEARSGRDVPRSQFEYEIAGEPARTTAPDAAAAHEGGGGHKPC